MIRVLLADDQALVRAGFRALLDAQGDIEVAGEASDGEQAVSLAREVVPDVVLMDIRMPGTDGLAATRQIAADERLAGVRVVILTTFELDEYVFEAIRSGAAGFLVKDTDPDELVQAVRVVADGGALLSPGVTRRLIGEFASRAKPPQPSGVLGELTDREREVLALVGEGLSNAEIAGRLYVSPATAKTHVSRAMVKLGARDRAQLVVIAYESGLVRPGWHGASPGRPTRRPSLVPAPAYLRRVTAAPARDRAQLSRTDGGHQPAAMRWSRCLLLREPLQGTSSSAADSGQFIVVDTTRPHERWEPT
jgi:DNA-binding NarL/FixJ family response regulator